MKIQAINKKHQSRVNKAVKWLVKHNTFNDLRDLADNEDDHRNYDKYDRLCEKTFDKFEDYLYELPKREQKNILTNDLY